jgi:hypothetical protein
VLRIQFQGAGEGLLGGHQVPGALPGSTQGDPRRDVARVDLQTPLENLRRLVQLALLAQEFTELEEVPGGRILPELVAELLNAIVHGKSGRPGGAR